MKVNIGIQVNRFLYIVIFSSRDTSKCSKYSIKRIKIQKVQNKFNKVLLK